MTTLYAVGGRKASTAKRGSVGARKSSGAGAEKEDERRVSADEDASEQKESKKPKKRTEDAEEELLPIDEELSKLKDELDELKHKLNGLDAVTEAFTGQHLVEALQDLDELREKLLSRGSAKGSIGICF